MNRAYYTFTRAGLEDDAATLRAEDNVNNLAGRACAQFIRSALAPIADGFVFDDVIVCEDWGWALVATAGPDSFILGCCGIEGGRWGVSISDGENGGVFPNTRARRTESALRLVDFFEKAMRAAGVAGLVREE